MIQNDSIKDALDSAEYRRSRIVFRRRMELGLSQTALAEKAGVTQKTISRVEGGDPGIRTSTIEKVYAALEMKEEVSAGTN
ncbi:helix-turn-helix domain-containing protein [Alkalicoccus daliensis]|uniref:Helix-turn-helix domain-containing protein n=1 Tax=Alkalicoccus daliensis TaxID=745820 RepID=A0A1H0D2A7_9BACI|nr:helix-turn-helix domain-containing protein [Alkalicoccus daliensis]SDN64283.1 Helix-turn-helix domain-containing protein [Alkalicoccus daliensis]